MFWKNQNELFGQPNTTMLSGYSASGLETQVKNFHIPESELALAQASVEAIH